MDIYIKQHLFSKKGGACLACPASSTTEQLKLLYNAVLPKFVTSNKVNVRELLESKWMWND